MNAKDALKANLASTQHFVTWFISDLADQDLLVRPVPKANHIAWQLGHVIASERNILKQAVPDADLPEFPAGFAEQHNKDTAGANPPTGFRTKEEYVGLFNKMHNATVAALEQLPEGNLENKITGSVARLAPTVGAAFQLISNHRLMHAGQFSVVRRQLGKPNLF